MSNLSLFDAPTQPMLTPPEPPAERPSDVLRRVQFKAGPWRTLRPLTDEERANPRVDHRVMIDREYVIVELRDGRVFCEFTDDGERKGAFPEVTPAFIDERIRKGEWIEVRA